MKKNNPSLGRIAWNRLTLMKYTKPGDDYEITPLRFLGGLIGMCAFIFMMSALAAAGF